MRRITLPLSLCLVALILVQVATPFAYAIALPAEGPTEVARAPLADPVHIDTLTMLTLDYDNNDKQYSLIVSEPGQYSFNMSFIVDFAWHFLGVDFSSYLRESMTQYVPHLHGDLDSMNGFWSDNWWLRTTGFADDRYIEFVAVQPGRIVIDFQMFARDPADEISVNFTLSQLYSFASAPSVDWDQTHALSFGSDNTWMGSKFVLPQGNLYNLSFFGQIDYATTGSWGGNPTFQPITKLTLFDYTYGERMPVDSYTPSFNIPAGAGSGTANWTYWQLYTLPALNYYFLVHCGSFEFLNGSQVTIQIDITPVPSSTIAADESVRLRFDSSPSGSSAYIGLSTPMGFEYDLLFNNHAGANWSVQCFDATGGLIPVAYGYYQDPSSYTTIEDRFEQAFSYVQPSMMGPYTPTPAVLGDQYYELFNLAGTGVSYVNGTAVSLSMHPGLYSPLETFYIRVDATPMGIPTTTFNITFHLQGTSIPPITPAVPETFAVNQTIGPIYQSFQLPLLSGYIYEISAWASDYSTSGGVSIFNPPVSGGYEDWQWGSFFVPLYRNTPSSSSPYDATATNETVTVRFVAVRSTTLYFGAIGIDMMGPAADTAEVTVNITVTAPVPYAVGTVVTETLSDMDFKTYSVSIMAGATYQLSLSLAPSGDYALLSTFNAFGHVPFMASLYTLWAEVASDYLNMTQTYTALVSGVVTIVLLSEGTVHFAFSAVGEAPGSFALGLIIGLIFMVMAIIIVYVVMRRRY